MTPTNPTDALTNGQYEVDDYGSIGEAARRICCFCEGDMRRLVYITAKEELAATEARAQGLVEALENLLDDGHSFESEGQARDAARQALTTWRQT